MHTETLRGKGPIAWSRGLAIKPLGEIGESRLGLTDSGPLCVPSHIKHVLAKYN